MSDNKNKTNVSNSNKKLSEGIDVNEIHPEDLVCLNKTPSFERVFWLTIVVMFILYMGFNFTAFFKNKTQELKVPLIGGYIEEFFATDLVRNNLSKNKEKIIYDMNLHLKNTYNQIDDELDVLFLPVERNLDVFLDFHYSVIGEYSELFAMSFGDVGALVQDKLFGSGFTKNLYLISTKLNDNYKKGIESHLSKINDIALDGLDADINIEALSRLDSDIQGNKLIQFEKLGLLAVARLGPQLLAQVSAKIANKLLVKVTAKAAAKLTVKGPATTAAVAATSVCGPFVVVCAPVAAIVTWVGADAAIITADEALHREEFKQEILVSIQSSKEVLRRKYKDLYYKAYNDFSLNVQDAYRGALFKEKRKEKIIDKL